MRDLLAAAASAFLAEAALPLLLWTLAAVGFEAALRVGRAHAALGLPARSALLAALPLSLAMGPLARWATPDAIVVSEPLVRVREAVLPEIVVGAPVAPLGPPDALVWLGAALALAAVVGALALVRLAVAHARLRRLNWPDAPDDVQDRARAALGPVGRRVRVVTGGSVPFTYGAWRPVVAVPRALAGTALDLALAHEAAHVRAHDYAAQIAARALAAVFATHPLVHVIVRGMALDRERLADATVLAGRPDARRAYADLLVSLSAVRAPRVALAVSTPPLLHRLTAMTTPTTPARACAARTSGRLLAALVLLVTTLAAFATDRPDRTFWLVNPTLSVDGTEIDLSVLNRFGSPASTSSFRFLAVTITGYGRFVLSDAPFDGATRAGAFDGHRLDVSTDGHTLSISAEAPLFDDRTEVPAYARFDAVAGAPATVPTTGFGLSFPESPDEPEPMSQITDDVRRMIASDRGTEPGAFALPPAHTTALGDTVFDFVERMPEIEGGMEALLDRVVYSEAARTTGIVRTAILRFAVTAAGRAEQVTVARSAGDARLDSAAVQAVRAQPFTPGRQRGRAVAVRLTLPIRFALPPTTDQGALPASNAQTDLTRYAASVDLSRLANDPEIQATLKDMIVQLAQSSARYDEAD